MKRYLTVLAVAAVAASLGSTGAGMRRAADAATAPPPPPPPVSATPRVAATVPPANGGTNPAGGAGASIPLNPGGATPAPGASGAPVDRKTMDGVWEVVIQKPDGDPAYDHFSLKQKGSVLTGTFLDNEHGNKRYPCAGSVDGKSVHLVVTKDDGSTMVFTGTVENYMDMLGLLQAGTQTIAFTAAYRPKEKFIDSISPVPGGFGGSASGGGMTPP